MKIGVIGVGKLGRCLLEVLSKHYDTVGVDRNDDFSKLKDRDVIFNVVNTPSKPDGNFSNEYLYESIGMAKPHINNCKVFTVVSTVMPGTCEKISRGLESKVCYNPEFIRLKSIKNDMKNPDFVLIGEEDKYSGNIIEGIYKKVLENNAPIKRMDWKSAELAKISLNSYITMKISFANTIGRIAKRIGADAEQILDAMGNDHRIGSAYFKSGGAYGGPCFPRDNRAFRNVAENILNYADLTDKINKEVANESGAFSEDEKYQNV
jgi:UDPglucose 6-dehydrogenase